MAKRILLENITQSDLTGILKPCGVQASESLGAVASNRMRLCWLRNQTCRASWSS